MVHLMLSFNCQPLLEIILDRRDNDTPCFYYMCSYEATLLNPSCDAFADCRSNFHLPMSHPRDVDFLWSPWKTPISALLHSL